MKLFYLISVFVFFIFSTCALAQDSDVKCSSEVSEILAKKMKIRQRSPKQDGYNVISSACKVWPFKSNLLLTTLAYDEGNENEKSLVIAIIDINKKRLISSLKRVITEDASTEVGENSLKLDTAKYQLNKNVRAFGIKFHSVAHGANCGSGYNNDLLTLVVPDGKILRSVLDLKIYQQRWLEGCPVTSPARWEDANLTLSTNKSSTNGYYDLLVSAKITADAEGVAKGDLKDRKEQHILRYDGKSYRKEKITPWWIEFQ